MTNLANPHFVDNLKFHARPKNGIDGLPYFKIEVGWKGASSSQSLDKEILPVVLLCLDSCKHKDARNDGQIERLCK